MGSAQSSHAKNQIAPAKEQLQKLEVSVNQCVRGRKSAHEIIKQSVVVIDDIEPTLEVEDEELDDSVVYESDEELNAGLEERREILKDAQLLKQYASFHLHPEAPVTSNGNACGRNYFSRPSALEYDSLEEMEERNMILEEAALLKQYATFHLHPELPVKTTDANACGRNYFSRPSALEYDSLEEMEERIKILEEAALLEQYATFHLHPELPVKTTEACGYNYFFMGTAPEQDLLINRPDCEGVNETMIGNQVRRDSFEERLNILDVANAPSKSTRQLGDVSQCFFSHSCNEGEMYDDYDDNHFDHEDISHEHLRASLSKVIVNNQFNPLGTFVSMKDDDEGHLSRSPSSIMLFGYDEGAQAH